MRLVAFCAAFVLSIVIFTDHAQAQLGAKKAGDPRVKELLEKAQLQFEVDADGDYKVVNKLDNGRTQIAFINSKSNELGHLEIREVWSPAMGSEQLPSAEVSNNLLQENQRVKLGAWQLMRSGAKHYAIFSAKIAADTDVKTLLLTLQAVTETADEKEKELLGTDDL